MGALPRMSGSSIDLRFVPVAQGVDLIYADLLQAPYVIDPDVLADSQPVSVLFDRTQGDVRVFLSSFLDSLGYSVTDRNGVAYIEKSKLSKDEADQQTFVYAPKYRDADYLSRIVSPVVRGRFTENRSVAAPEGAKVASDVPATSAAGLIDQSADVLVFVGSAREVAVLGKLLPQLDTPVANVSVRAWVYEVTDTGTNNSAFQLAMSVLDGRVGASLNVGSISGTDNAIRLSVGGFNAALSALNSDSRFKVLTSPNLRVRSGDTASLNVGESVPVIGSVSFPSSTAAPVQSVVYQDAGVIFQVKPTVKRDAINLQLVEEISSFANTTTGVNNSPTKNTRKVESSFSLADGDVLLIGGLTQDQDTHANSGLSFLPALDGWSHGVDSQDGDSADAASAKAVGVWPRCERCDSHGTVRVTGNFFVPVHASLR
ncbi:type II secretory pathway protein [Paraburkholderia sp. SARCC-3016]|uniref:type II secretion system protein GspD n=1 Tax=Paraburkholderia sp. SARCC-3016 TaxID=3058611 RepID=UPI002808F0A7|nr:type II secretory pathway protein [Paraburkholderia sp. SARCC-3016]MDQ7982423.1 type II secretory pathway protein [Paraburkholderia sp. SARCC-3016]